MRIVFLTPNLPGVVCGLADHSRLLGSALARRGYEVSIIGRNGDLKEAQAAWHGDIEVWNGTPSSFCSLLGSFRPDVLLVQLSGYGYSRWGAPWVLGSSLKVARRQCRNLSIAICVHELHCRPGQLGFKGPLLSPWQRLTLGRILHLADVVFPTAPWSREECVRTYGLSPGSVQLLPIAANVPRLLPTKEKREQWRRDLGLAPSEPAAVTFGRWSSQKLALERLGPVVRKAITEGSLSSVVAVGGENSTPPAWVSEFLAKLPWAGRLKVLGEQSAERIAEVLAAVDVGLVPTPWPVWEKSGAARAFEQAGLTLWVFDPETNGCRVVPPNSNPPTWDSLAETVAKRLSVDIERRAPTNNQALPLARR